MEQTAAKVFARVGLASDIAAGNMRAFGVSGLRVNVASVQGVLHAIDDTCTHTGCSLAAGRLEGTVVTCGCHGSQFDVTTGAVLRGPARRPLRSLEVLVDDGALLIGT